MLSEPCAGHDAIAVHLHYGPGAGCEEQLERQTHGGAASSALLPGTGRCSTVPRTGSMQACLTGHQRLIKNQY